MNCFQNNRVITTYHREEEKNKKESILENNDLHKKTKFRTIMFFKNCVIEKHSIPCQGAQDVFVKKIAFEIMVSLPLILAKKTHIDNYLLSRESCYYHLS